MRLCERAPGTAEYCANAVLAPSGTATVNGDAVFRVSATDLAFGFDSRPAPSSLVAAAYARRDNLMSETGIAVRCSARHSASA
jgi:hypothetical protein